MDNIITYIILGLSIFFVGKRIYKQIFWGEGCSNCDCGSHNNCCSYYNDINSNK